MEIRYERVYHLEFVAGIDKNARVCTLRYHRAVVERGAFECAAGRCANGDDSAARGSCRVDLLCRLLGNGEKFAVHNVLVYFFYLDGAESAEAHVEHNGHDLNTHSAYLIEKLLREVEPRRGRGGRAFLARIHSLVVAVILKLCRDVGRQGHFADGIENGIKRFSVFAAVIEFYDTAAVLRRREYRCAELAVAENDLCPLFKPSAGARKHLPRVQLLLAQKHEFNVRRALAHLFAVDARGNNLGIVDYKHVAGAQIFRNIAENFMFYSFFVLMKHHKPCFVALFVSVLRNKLLGQVKCEIARFKVCFCKFVSYHS